MALRRRVKPMKPWRELLLKFDTAARALGVGEACDTPSDVLLRNYNRTKKALINRIAAMEVVR